jgi:Protein of unknown function (DUF2752)
MTRKREHLFLAAAIVGGIAGLVFLRALDPATSGIYPPCPVYYLTGWYCPGCGSLRAIHQLLEGNLRGAWAMNPLTVMLLPFLAYGMASETFRLLRGKGLPQIFIPGAWIQVLCAVIIVFGIARNLPLYPFHLLAPGATLPH